MQKTIIQALMIFFVTLIGVAGLASANPLILHAYSPETTWIADGVTPHLLIVEADSTPDVDAVVRSIQFGYTSLSSSNYQFNLVSVSRPTTNDFFSGAVTTLLSGNNLISRVVTAGTMPVNKQGNFVYMTYVVSATNTRALPLQTSLQFDADPEITKYRVGGNNYQPELQSTPFTVMTSMNSHDMGDTIEASGVCPIDDIC